MMRNNNQVGVCEDRKNTKGICGWKDRLDLALIGLWNRGKRQDPGIDGILVTVGLCIIALLLCVVMKNSLSDFIQNIVKSMTKEATDILSGTRV